MEYLTVKNWEQFQHYSDRSPAWIKLHRAILDDYEFCRLSDATKALLMLIWVLASQQNGRIPNDPEYLKNKLSLESTPDISILIEKGFLASSIASGARASRKRPARKVLGPEEKRREEKREAASTLAAPTPEHASLAASLGVSCEAEWAKFRDYGKAKGRRHKDEAAAFRNWLRNAAEYAKRDGVVPITAGPSRKVAL